MSREAEAGNRDERCPECGAKLRGLGAGQARVLELILQGKTPRQITRELNLSGARVYQVLSRLRDKGLLPRHDDAA